MHGVRHQLVPPNEAEYLEALDMVSYPRECIDAEGMFVGYDCIEDQLIAYRDSYAITEEEYQYLRKRLFNERDNDPKYNKES